MEHIQGDIHRLGWPTGNTYIIREQGRLAVVDMGFARYRGRIRAFIEQELRSSLDHVDLIVLTHRHPDHCGGVDALMALCPSARLAAFPRTAGSRPGRMIRPTVAQLGRMVYRWGAAGFPRIRTRFRTPVSVVLEDGAALPGVFAGWNVIHTPGHADDHVCLYHGNSGRLVSGDVFVYRENRWRPISILTDPESFFTTIERLRRLRITALYPGHGEPLTDGDLHGTIAWDAWQEIAGYRPVL